MLKIGEADKRAKIAWQFCRETRSCPRKENDIILCKMSQGTCRISPFMRFIENGVR